MYEILAEFCQRDRIPFAHVRNIKFLDNRDFYEAPHKSEYGSLDMYRILKQCMTTDLTDTSALIMAE